MKRKSVPNDLRDYKRPRVEDESLNLLIKNLKQTRFQNLCNSALLSVPLLHKQEFMFSHSQWLVDRKEGGILQILKSCVPRYDDCTKDVNITFQDIKKFLRDESCLLSFFFCWFATFSEQVYIIKFFKSYILKNLELSMKRSARAEQFFNETCGRTLQLARDLLGQVVVMTKHQALPKVKVTMFAILSKSFLVSHSDTLLEFEPEQFPEYWECDRTHSEVFRCNPYSITDDDLKSQKEYHHVLNMVGISLKCVPVYSDGKNDSVSDRHITILRRFLYLLDDSEIYCHFRNVPSATIHMDEEAVLVMNKKRITSAMILRNIIVDRLLRIIPVCEAVGCIVASYLELSHCVSNDRRYFLLSKTNCFRLS